MKFDYIIAGGGTAGCVLANRLSEDPQKNVLLIEAGPQDHHPLIRVPAAFSELFKSGLDWKDETVPQAGLNGQRMYSPRGRVLGGCSSINAMIFLRPHPSDLKRWNQPGWSWAECLPLLQKVEQQFGFHHDDGEAYSREKFYQHPLTDRFLEATSRCGFNRGLQSSTVQSATFPFLKNIRRGRRNSVVDAYLRPAIRRPNLKVLTGALIDRFEIRDGEIRHVILRHQNQVKQLVATSSYLLAAGSFQSPAILQRSGAGPADLLDRLGINSSLINDQIGANLQDHLICGFAYRVNPNQSLDALQQWIPRLRELWRWMTGQYSQLSSNIAEAGAFRFDSNGEPELQYHFGPVFFIRHGFDRRTPHGISFGPTLIRPASRGSVAISSPDPQSPLIIDPRYYEAPGDMEAMLIGLHKAMEIAQQEPLRPVIQRMELPEREPADENDLKAHLREYSQTLYHPVGTCRMDSKAGVVDPFLKVSGLSNLRIADASIMPLITSSNTQTTVMMIAEKAAQMILEEGL